MAGGGVVRRFAVVAAAATFVQGVYFGYLVSVLTSVERRFSLSSGQSGSLLSAYDLGHAAAVLVVGHYGGRVHQPRCIAALSLLCALSCVGLAAPHALAHAPQQQQLDQVAHGLTTDRMFGMCHDAKAVVAKATQPTVDRVSQSTLPLAFCILAVSQLVAGVGGAAFDVLTYVYVDDNASAKRSPHYLGVISAMFGYGPAAGFLLGALTANMPQNLGAPSAGELTGGRQQPIGAWWLGLVVCAALFAMAAVPFALFPKSVGAGKEDNACEEKIALKKVDGCNETGPKPASWIRGVALDMAELCGNALFLWLTVMWTCDAFLFGGADTFGPKYLEEHFGQTTSAANIITAAMTVCGTATATVVGGRLLSALDVTPRTGLLLLLCAKLTGVAALFAGAFIACPSAPAPGWAYDAADRSLSAPLLPLCDSACACDPSQYAPVCLNYGTDESATHYSACSYGCRNASMPLDSANCPCLMLNETLANGYCEENISCQGQLVAFLIFNFSQAFSNGLFVVAGYTALLKAVAKEKKSFALAINTFVVSIFGYMPSQVAFGALFDLACVHWAAGTGGTGSCLAYDRRSLRLNFNLAAGGVAALGLLAGLMAWRAARRFDWPGAAGGGELARRRYESECHDDSAQKRHSYYPYDVGLCHEIGMVM